MKHVLSEVDKKRERTEYQRRGQKKDRRNDEVVVDGPVSDVFGLHHQAPLERVNRERRRPLEPWLERPLDNLRRRIDCESHADHVELGSHVYCAEAHVEIGG